MTRRAIFDAIRAARGKGFTPGEVQQIDAVLDGLGIGRDAPEKAVERDSGLQGADPFTHALTVILRHEGGFVNHPRDPGGMTNLGVTKRTWEGWTGKKAFEADMRALTAADVAPLYRKNYWDKLRCDDLPPALALCVFDFGVNAGPARAARFLQRLSGSSQDGVAGDTTVAVANEWAGRVGIGEAVKAYQDARRAYYRSLPTFGTFGRGWLRRVDETEAEARKLT